MQSVPYETILSSNRLPSLNLDQFSKEKRLLRSAEAITVSDAPFEQTLTDTTRLSIYQFSSPNLRTQTLQSCHMGQLLHDLGINWQESQKQQTHTQESDRLRHVQIPEDLF